MGMSMIVGMNICTQKHYWPRRRNHQTM